MSLYGEYIREREGLDILETKNGFVVWSVNGDNLWIHELYIRPEARRSKLATAMAQAVVTRAKTLGCSKMFAQVDMMTRCATLSKAAVLSFGMVPVKASDDGERILFAKEI